jgi:hypothetical protein
MQMGLRGASRYESQTQKFRQDCNNTYGEIAFEDLFSQFKQPQPLLVMDRLGMLTVANRPREKASICPVKEVFVFEDEYICTLWSFSPSCSRLSHSRNKKNKKRQQMYKKTTKGNLPGGVLRRIYNTPPGRKTLSYRCCRSAKVAFRRIDRSLGIVVLMSCYVVVSPFPPDAICPDSGTPSAPSAYISLRTWVLGGLARLVMGVLPLGHGAHPRGVG